MPIGFGIINRSATEVDRMGGQGIPESILTIARTHVAGRPPITGFVWRLSQGQRVSTGWYFDYSFDRLPSNPPGPGSGIGGAPGFVVTDDGTIKVVRWHELRTILDSEPSDEPRQS